MLEPKYVEAYYNCGTIYQQRKQLDLAIDDFRKARDLFTNPTLGLIRFHGQLRPDCGELPRLNNVAYGPPLNYPTILGAACQCAWP
jgi:tetratricopeptide (TPR) repeat protein